MDWYVLIVYALTIIYSHKTDLLDNAKSEIRIACFYSNLRNNYTDPKEIGGWMGNSIFDALVRAHQRGIKVTIVQNSPSKEFPNLDSEYLKEHGMAQVINIDWNHALHGGILHTKLLIADDNRFYVGSANLDWTSLAQVKELGVFVSDCPCLTKDIAKIWGVYEFLGANLKSSMLSKFDGWPEALQTKINMDSPVNMTFAGSYNHGEVFIASSPAPINPPDRTNDITALLSVISDAQETLVISVMDYLPLDIYSTEKAYWSEIETGLKEAMIRNVTVRMLISRWSHSPAVQAPVLQALNQMGELCKNAYFGNNKNVTWCTGKIEIRQFEIPDPKGYDPVPFSRVNHAKYMVSESQAYISTSNWSYDYFYRTAGISFISTHAHLRQTVQDIFDRDWNSEYAYPVQ
jgi:phospholipase D3/4